MWLPNILFFLLTVYVFHRVDSEKPLLPERLQAAVSRLYELLIQPLITIVGKGWKRVITRRTPQDPTENTVEIDENLPVHANAVSRIYHFSVCEDYTCSECTIEFLTSTIAEESGFKPCPFCKSLVEKQKT
jgi:lipopolysaccharide export system permease protein